MYDEPPNPRLQKTATDAALSWCRVFVLFFCFLSEKIGVFPEKVYKIAFLGAVKLIIPSSQAHYSLS